MAKRRFKGALFVDQDGTLANEERAGLADPSTDRAHVRAPLPPLTAEMTRDNKREPIVTQSTGLGFEGVPTDDLPLTQSMEFSLDDFFADPSVLFPGPSSTGFTGIGDQRTAGDAMAHLFGNP